MLIGKESYCDSVRLAPTFGVDGAWLNERQISCSPKGYLKVRKVSGNRLCRCKLLERQLSALLPCKPPVGTRQVFRRSTRSLSL